MAEELEWREGRRRAVLVGALAAAVIGGVWGLARSAREPPPATPAPAEVEAPSAVGPEAAAPESSGEADDDAPIRGEPCVASGAMLNWRYSPSATVLLDGRVLVAGGRHHDGSEWLTDAEYFDPRSGTFSRAPSMKHERAMHAGARLPDGRVLVAGGHKVVELFDPKTSRWRDLKELFFVVEPGVTILNDGRAYVGGGDMMSRGALSPYVDLWDPAKETWTSGALDDTRSRGDALRLPDGHVLARDIYDKGSTLHEYDPSTDAWRPATDETADTWRLPDNELVPDEVAHVVVHPDGRPRMPPTFTWSGGVVEHLVVERRWRTHPFTRNHPSHAAALLDDGRLFVVGSLEAPSVAELCSL